MAGRFSFSFSHSVISVTAFLNKKNIFLSLLCSFSLSFCLVFRQFSRNPLACRSTSHLTAWFGVGYSLLIT